MLGAAIMNFAAQQAALNRAHFNRSDLLIDTFLFNNELDVLEWRLSEHDEWTQLFIACETNRTHTGLSKPMTLRENWARLHRWHHKLIVISLDLPPLAWPLVGWHQFAEEKRQRDAILVRVYWMYKNGLLPGDAPISVHSDADEVYERNATQRVLAELRAWSAAHAASAAVSTSSSILKRSNHSGHSGTFFRLQAGPPLLFLPQYEPHYYSLLCRSGDQPWTPQRRTVLTVVAAAAQLPRMPRDARGDILPPVVLNLSGVVGWHLSYAGGAGLVQNKLRSIALDDQAVHHTQRICTAICTSAPVHSAPVHLCACAPLHMHVARCTLHSL